MAEWPDTLPVALQVAGYQEQPPETLLRTQMDAGPAKQRRRYTANVRPITGTITVDKDQLAIFDDFFVNTLQGGAIPFDWFHPRADSSPPELVQMRFTAQPVYTPVDPEVWQVAMALEIMP